MKVDRFALPALVLILLLAACAPNLTTAQPEAPQAEQGVIEPVEDPTASTAAVDTPPAADDPTDEPVEAALPTETEAPVQNTEISSEECPFSPELHATNPGAVALASGEIQLVEFFAFW